MSDQQYSDAMADLQHQREQLLAGKPAAERRRILAMRNTMLWHLNNVSDQCGPMCQYLVHSVRECAEVLAQYACCRSCLLAQC